ncbi:hypothetical protein [Labrys wisconsinensis]|uniref:Uncharacterized protein n=1 Tax=Labrys wisconsinensis TaxID=425677 RepID=A0ABU0JIM3_9HYPH|nr:hypothetical protein [Labrys wisconsinensis]MDQ0473475.1 hypothetical protein [Labrys wisconsinensis]
MAAMPLKRALPRRELERIADLVIRNQRGCSALKSLRLHRVTGYGLEETWGVVAIEPQFRGAAAEAIDEAIAGLREIYAMMDDER